MELYYSQTSTDYHKSPGTPSKFYFFQLQRTCSDVLLLILIKDTPLECLRSFVYRIWLRWRNLEPEVDSDAICHNKKDGGMSILRTFFSHF